MRKLLLLLALVLGATGTVCAQTPPGAYNSPSNNNGGASAPAGTGVVRASGGSFPTPVADTTAPTGSVATASNGNPFVFANPGLQDSPNSPVNSGGAYTLACPSATDQADNNRVVRFQSGANTSPLIPLSTSGNCSHSAFLVFNDNAGTLTFTRSSPDTFSAYGCATNGTGLTTFTVANGQTATINQGASGLWEVRCLGVGSSLWSALGNPAANLILLMGSDTSEFDTTSAVSNFFKWANTTAATSSVSQSSPILSLCGQGWESATPANTQDCSTLQQVIPNGANTSPGLTITDTGASTSGIPYTLTLPNGTTVKTPSSNLIFNAGSLNSVVFQSSGNNMLLGQITNGGNTVNVTIGNTGAFSSGTTVNLVDETSGITDEITTQLKATAALTAGQVVKPDTSNASSVVVTVTTDTGAGVPLGFVENSPGAGAAAYIAMPGSIITDPVLGTGTCAIGNFVIVDTTTNGRIKCTSTFTAGTVLGKALTAQNTVGNTVTVYVSPM